MNRPRRIAAFLTVLSAALACNLPESGGTPTLAISINPLVASPTAMATPLPTVPPLTEAMLKNGTYKLPQFGETVTLVNGAYDRATSNEDILHVALLDPIAFGDLNGDGAGDAAVLLSENNGGSGFLVSVVVMLNQKGTPVQSASYFIGDRQQVNNLTIQNERIIVNAVIHGVQDPMCCPTFPVTETLRLENGKLILIRFTSIVPGGQVREINITAPAPGTAVSGQLQVTGNVSISPFENTLAYVIYAAAGNKLSNGPIPVSSDGMGTPGTFSAAIDISAIPSGTAIRLEISDLSAADGSILAMDSVDCQIS
jgi:hypothetical protein